eukprot:351046_1
MEPSTVIQTETSEQSQSTIKPNTATNASHTVCTTTNDTNATNDTQQELAIKAIACADIPSEAIPFTFGSQIMIIGLNSRAELNKKLGFVVGDYKKYSQRIPIRLITNSESSKPPTYLLKPQNLQFVSQPIPGYDVERYQSDSNPSDESDSDLSEYEQSDDNESTSSSESSLSPSITNLQSMNLNKNKNPIDDTANDEDDDIKITEDKLQKVNEKMTKYHEIMEQFNKPETIDLASITSTKSLPIDCGLRWEPKPVTESIENLEIVRIGSIKNIINDIEIVIESFHSPETVITFDSVLCLSDHTAVGRVDDIFGAVKKPYYFVRLTVDKAMLLKDKITLNQDVYAVKPLCHFAVPPQTDERYSSESECGSDSGDEYGPNKIRSNAKKGSHKRHKRAMSVDRESVANRNRMNRRGLYANNNRNKRKYYAGSNHMNKRQRYSAPYSRPVQQHTMAHAYQPYYYPGFNALPTAIPPPQITQAASMFRPQVNIIPSPPTSYMNTMNMYNVTPPQTQRVQHIQSATQPIVSVQAMQQPQPQTQQGQSGKITVDPFSFGVIQKK